MSAHLNFLKMFGGSLGLAFLLAGSPAQAEEPDLSGDAERLASEGLSKILGALGLLMQTIPQYAAPEVQPNGDIIIRRLHPDDAPQQKPEEKGDGSSDGTET
jgi:hypothetical protein